MMMFSRYTLTLACTAALALTGCGANDRSNAEIMEAQAHYWQRMDNTSATYLRGPKAQQFLNRDISRCVVEVRELERLGAIREATPADKPVANTAEEQLAQWETPERQGQLRAEHLEFHDFESCMNHKGWERVKYVPFDISEDAKETYAKTVLGKKYDRRTGTFKVEKEGHEGDWDNLNE